MVDNIAITAGTGTTVATDNISGANYQRIKMVLGADGVADGDVSSSLPMPTSPPVAVPFTITPTVTAGAYATGTVVGGLISITGAARNSGGSGTVQSVIIDVKTTLTAAYDVIFFDTQPTNSTFTDNAALNVNTADLPFRCGTAHCTDLVSLGTPQELQALSQNIVYKLNTGTTLYAVVVLRGAQSFASTTAVVLNFRMLPD